MLIPVDHVPSFLDDEVAPSPLPSPPLPPRFPDDADPLLAPGAQPGPPERGWLGIARDAFDLSRLTGLPAAADQAAQSDEAQRALIREGRYGAAALTGLDNPLLYGLGTGNVGKVGRPAARLAAPVEAEAPFDAAANAKAFASTLRDEHLARDSGLPLSGPTMPVAPPPHIRTADDMTGLVNHYVELALEGEAAKNWYLESGGAIARAANDPKTAEKFVSTIARTSPQTDVASNLTHAIGLHNQAMLGDPLRGGRFPRAMGADVEKYYYGNDPVTGEKIAPFHHALDVGGEWNPDFPHAYVNDVWNMRALQYEGPGGKPYDGSPSLGQHNFTRIAADRALDEIERRTGVRWDPKELQAASWAAAKSRAEGAPVAETAQNYAHGLARNYAQASWESAPGLKSNHFPEYHTAPMADRQAFHDEIRSALTDDRGGDIIHRHLGLLTGPGFDAPGVYQSRVNPGTQSQVALGQAPGGYAMGVDPAGRQLMNVAESVRGLLLRQDASAWHKPSYGAGLANKDLNQANMADIRVGRRLTMEEAATIGNEMARRLGGNDFFSPIATPQGYRLINVPSETGLSNRQFWGHVRDVVASDLHPEAHIVHAISDGNYITNDWRKSPNGEDFIGEVRRTGRPDVQRAAAELLATLGPRIQQIEERWAQSHGWTPDRNRPWENPIIERYADAVVPNPPRPWLRRPAPPGGPDFMGPPLPGTDPRSLLPAARPFLGIAPALPAGLAAGGAAYSLYPVDHDPFAEGP